MPRLFAVLALFTLTYSAVGCTPAGAPAGPDMSPGGACHFADGRSCDRVVGCADPSACNWCGCGDPLPNCSQAACGMVTDGGFILKPPPRCTSRADCGASEHCIFDIGCGTTGLCVNPTLCGFGPYYYATPASGPTAVCGCDGKTVTVDAHCGIPQPYRYTGACR